MTRRMSRSFLVLALLCAASVSGQTATPAASPQEIPAAATGQDTTGVNLPAGSNSVPRLIRFSGTLKDGSGKLVTGSVNITFAIYADQDAAAPVWQETQSLTLDEQARYSALLGVSQPQGLPADLFTTGEARWLGVTPADLPEQPRVLIVSVPYALKAGDAETLGGKPASAYMPALPTQEGVQAGPAKAGSTPSSTLSPAPSSLAAVMGPMTVGSGSGGTVNYVAKWTDASNDLGNSLIYDNGTNIGIGTMTPQGALDLGSGRIGRSLVWGGQSGTPWYGTIGTSVSSAALNLLSGLSLSPGADQTLYSYTGSYYPAGIRVDSTNGALSFFIGPSGTHGAGQPFPYSGYTALYLSNSGNMGVGTTTPQGALDLGAGTKGRSLVWGGQAGTNWYGTIGTSYSSAALNLLSGLSLSPSADQTLYSYTGSYYPAGVRVDSTNGAISFFIGPNGSQTAGQTFNYGANTRLYLSNSGAVGIGTTSPNATLQVNGNVGIGTTSQPAATLEVNGTAKFDSTVNFTGSSISFPSGSISPASLAAGTAGISITGNAATSTAASSASNSANLGGVASSDYARLDVGNSFTGNQSMSANLIVGGTTSRGNNLVLEVQGGGGDALTVNSSTGAVGLGTGVGTHIITNSANTDFAGTATLPPSGSVNVTFNEPFSSPPVCVATPVNAPVAVSLSVAAGRSGGGNYPTLVISTYSNIGNDYITVNYICVGNPN